MNLKASGQAHVCGLAQVLLPDSGETMKTLLDKYRINPSPALHAKVLAYHRKHPFAECLLSPADQALLIQLEQQA
jgi:hypothetical protein